MGVIIIDGSPIGEPSYCASCWSVYFNYKKLYGLQTLQHHSREIETQHRYFRKMQELRRKQRKEKLEEVQ